MCTYIFAFYLKTNISIDFGISAFTLLPNCFFLAFPIADLYIKILNPLKQFFSPEHDDYLK